MPLNFYQKHGIKMTRRVKLATRCEGGMSYILTAPKSTLIPLGGGEKRRASCIAYLCARCLPVTLSVLLTLTPALAQTRSFMRIPLSGLKLSGKVTLKDGSAPPERVRIELICENQILPQAHTQSDGGFSFSVGGSQAFEVHARSDTIHPNSGPRLTTSQRNYSLCEVRAALAGYRSSKIKLGHRHEGESSDIGVIVLYRGGEKHAPLTSSDTLSRENALLAYQQAERELINDQPDAEKASKELLKAVEGYPEFAAAWNLLAEARIRAGDLEGALPIG